MMARNLGPKSVIVLKSIAAGHTYEQVLALHPDLTYLDIFNAAREALVLTESELTADQERLARIRKVYPRAYHKWSEEEDTTLDQLVQSGWTVEEIASQMQRQPSAIGSRIQKLGLP